MDTAEAVRLIRLRIRNYQRGLYCRAVMWQAITQIVTLESAEPVLNLLTTQEQTNLRSEYADWPPSLWSGRQPEEHAVCAAVERWCRQAEASG